ncbi:inositol monophosphatase family protein [Streptomyces sp. NPDC002640]
MTEPHRTELRRELLEIAREAARRAGELLRDGRPADLEVAATKSSPIDVVTEMDIAAEKLIVDLISARRPEDGFLGEEGASSVGTSGVRWVVDPLDGTVNYLYGLPSWSVSIAAELDGETLAGAVEIPMRGEAFHAVLGGGAWVTGLSWDGERKLAVRPSPPLDQALIATGFNYVTAVRTHQAEVARALLPLVRDIRRGGSAAVDLCDLAAGRLDGYYERGLHPWDRAAGDLIAREAGAVTGGRPGERPSDDLTVAATAGVVEPLQSLLERLGAWHD